MQDLEAVDFSVVTMARKLRAVLTTEVQHKAPEGKAMGMATDKELRSVDFPHHILVRDGLGCLCFR